MREVFSSICIRSLGTQDRGLGSNLARRGGGRGRGMCGPIGVGFCGMLVWNRVWFSRDLLRDCMNVFIVSIPNE